MQTESQIRHKLQQVVYRHYQRRCKQAFKVLPINCKHNIPVTDDDKPLKNPEVRLCKGPRLGQVCMTPDHASLCPLFEYAKSKNDIRDEVSAMVRNPVGEIAAAMPDVAALRWVLGEEDPAEVPIVDEPVVQAAAPRKKWWRLPWFKR